MSVSKNYYFVSNIEGDFLICAGVSQLIKRVKQNAKTIMLMPEHPRVQNKMQDYYKCFDEVLILPYVSFNKNLLKGIKECNYFIEEFKKIEIPKESSIFLFDIYELSELLIYSNLAKNRSKNKLKINCISAFEVFDPNKNDLTLLWLKSMFLSFYSLVYAKKKFLNYKTKNTSTPGNLFFKANWDISLCIQEAVSNSSNFKQIYSNLNYPPIFISKDNSNDIINRKSVISENCFIILVATSIPWVYSITAEHYWGQINNLIDYLCSRHEYSIYVKNHPGFPGESGKWIKNKRVSFIDNQVFSEELYLDYGKYIKGVFGYGSTGLLTASWFGIESINLDQYLGASGEKLNRVKKFMKLAPDIKSILHLENLDEINFRDEVDMNKKLEGFEKWKYVINNI